MAQHIRHSSFVTYINIATPHLAAVRSYLGYYTGSHQNSAVKRLWAGIVLGWVTSREVPVSHPFCLYLLPPEALNLFCRELSCFVSRAHHPFLVLPAFLHCIWNHHVLVSRAPCMVLCGLHGLSSMSISYISHGGIRYGGLLA